MAPSEEGHEFSLSFDKGLSPLQRRKAHMMCAYNDCEHNSVGTGLSRRVEMSYKRAERSRVNNPMDDGTPKSTDEAQGREKQIRDSGGSLEPPGPLLTHLHTVLYGVF